MLVILCWRRIELMGVVICSRFRCLCDVGLPLQSQMLNADPPTARSPGRTEPSVFRQMYQITADSEATFEDKTRRLIDLGRQHLDLSYGFLTRIEGASRDDSGEAEQAQGVQKIVYASGDHTDLQAGESCVLSKAYCRKTIQHDELLSIQNAMASGWESDPAYEAFDLGAYIGSRIMVEGELYGTFCFASRDARCRPFSEDEEAFVELLTRWTSYELEQQRSRERIEQFAKLVTHDLRSPLSAAQIHLYLAQRLVDESYAETDQASGGTDAPVTGKNPAEEESGSDDFGAKVQRHLSVTERALQRMESIIADTLALAHGEQTIGPDDLKPVRLRTVAEAAWEQAGGSDAAFEIRTSSGRERAGEKAASTDPRAADRGAEPGLRFLAHEGRLQQLLENLFRNAIDHAGPDVTVTVGESESGFFVADDGPGIPPEKREQIFEPSYSTREGGTGLGLSIVRAVAKAHGWSLSVSESAGGGARFDVRGVERPEE